MSNTSPNYSFHLASGSPRRRELLEQLGYRFNIIVPDILEECLPSESPISYVERLSLEKAQAGFALAPQEDRLQFIPVLGSDTIVVVDEQVLEKPSNYQDALSMLLLLSDRKHQVITAVSVVNGQHHETISVITDVWFKPLTVAEIEEYWQTGEPCDKAGAYGIQGIGGRFVKRIEGSFHAVMGLPLMETDQLLSDFLK